MSMIKVDNLSFSYPTSYDNIFENVSFQIDTDWKLGFIGRNGRGKTTFLNLLLGKYEYKGHIHASVQFDYFPYPVPDKTQLTMYVLQTVCPEAQEWQLLKELSLLEVKEDVLWRPFETLSNGEQTKVLLAALFLNEGHFLLIDEPTNHLDMQAREIVSAYLLSKKGFILVSHDRRFLDGCIDHVLSINKSNIEVQAGNFSSWKMNFDRQQAFELGQNDRLQKDIKRMQRAAQQTSSWSDKVENSKIGGHTFDRGAVGHKAAKMMKRSKAIEQRQEAAIEEKSSLLKNFEASESLKLSPLSYRTSRLAGLSEVCISYDDRPVCGPLTFDILQGDRIALDGRNGCGKSSLLKLLIGTEHQPAGVPPVGMTPLESVPGSSAASPSFGIPHTGLIRKGTGLIISYVPQDTAFLRGTLKEYAMQCRIDESLFLAILRKMDFERVQFEKDMKDFSGGQKKKVLIARSLCEKAHLYIWDEPLNFIDIYSRMQIEDLLQEFQPTMIFVEHDKAFRENIATRVISM